MTSRPSALLRLAAAVALAASLAGCVSLLPKQKPSPLYSFGATPVAATQTTPAGGARVGVYRAGGVFQREAAGDRILTVTGAQAAYIAQARWVGPAEVLFDAAVAGAFDASNRVRLIARGEPGRADYALRLDMRNFETRYADKDGAPTVVVRLRAVVIRQAQAGDAAERIFEAQVPAADNRIHAIVAAYDKALAQVLGDLMAWVEASASPRA